MRLGMITSSYPLTADDTVNAGVFVRDLAIELANLGHQVHVFTPKKYGRADPASEIAVHYIPWWGGAKDLASLPARDPLVLIRFLTLLLYGTRFVERYTRQLELDANLAMWAIPSGLFAWRAARRHGVPYGVWALGSDIWARRKYPFGDRLVRLVLKEAGFRFADGKELAGQAAILAGKPCDFVPSVRRLPAAATQGTVNLPGTGPHFLFIGRYEANKGPDVLVEAMRLLLSSGASAHLHLFGGGSLFPRLQEMVRGYETYIHLGGYAAPQVAMAYLSACDWLVIPSRIESIPLIFVDSLQMHIPVIATQVGDLGELVKDYRVGEVVPPDDPEQLANALRGASACRRGTFTGDWERALKIFSLESTAARCQEALEALLQEGRAG
jgi:glycosyltransferase involved in cell wall biosynthesis